jgi:hypothetical protein
MTCLALVEITEEAEEEEGVVEAHLVVGVS